MSLPERAVAYICFTSLVDQSNRPQFKINPTIVAADVNISLDGGAFAPLSTTPVVTPLGSRLIKISLTAAEMDAEVIIIQFVDDAGSEWDDRLITINTTLDVDIDGSVTGTPTNTIFDGDANLSTVVDLYNTMFIVFTTGTLRGLNSQVSDYSGSSTKTFTVNPAFPVAPTVGDRFKIIGRT